MWLNIPYMNPLQMIVWQKDSFFVFLRLLHLLYYTSLNDMQSIAKYSIDCFCPICFVCCMSPAGWTLAGHQPIVTREILGEFWCKVAPLLQYGTSRSVYQLHCWQHYFCMMWQCDMGIVQSNSIHFDMTCRIAKYQDIQWYFWNANNTFKLSIYYLFVCLMPCLVKCWHSVDPTQYVVLLLAELQHVQRRLCLLFFGCISGYRQRGIYQTNATWSYAGDFTDTYHSYQSLPCAEKEQGLLSKDFYHHPLVDMLIINLQVYKAISCSTKTRHYPRYNKMLSIFYWAWVDHIYIYPPWN